MPDRIINPTPVFDEDDGYEIRKMTSNEVNKMVSEIKKLPRMKYYDEETDPKVIKAEANKSEIRALLIRVTNACSTRNPPSVWEILNIVKVLTIMNDME